jgi:hypothetical protein
MPSASRARRRRSKAGRATNRSMKVEALFSLYPPLRIDSDFHHQTYEKFIDYLRTVRQLQIHGSHTHSGETLSVRVERCSASQQKRFFVNAPFFKPGDWLLRFDGSFIFPGENRFFVTDHTGKRAPYTEDELRAMWAEWLPDELYLTLQTYVCSLMIAFPGTVRPTENVWLLEGKQFKFSHRYVSTIHESVEYLVENGMMPRTDNDPEKVRRWIFSQNGVFDGYSDTPAARSLNYFTRLFAERFHDDELTDLVWALAGIEALLVEGGRSSVGQLKEKLAAIFGTDSSLEWMRKMTDKMYNYRSRMVHGNRQIRSAFRIFEEEQSEARLDEQYDSARLQ